MIGLLFQKRYQLLVCRVRSHWHQSSETRLNMCRKENQAGRWLLSTKATICFFCTFIYYVILSLSWTTLNIWAKWQVFNYRSIAKYDKMWSRNYFCKQMAVRKRKHSGLSSLTAQYLIYSDVNDLDLLWFIWVLMPPIKTWILKCSYSQTELKQGWK